MTAKDKKTEDPMAKVRIRFTRDALHCGLPFQEGDEITTEAHWADSIEAVGSGHRITDKE